MCQNIIYTSSTQCVPEYAEDCTGSLLCDRFIFRPFSLSCCICHVFVLWCICRAEVFSILSFLPCVRFTFCRAFVKLNLLQCFPYGWNHILTCYFPYTIWHIFLQCCICHIVLILYSLPCEQSTFCHVVCDSKLVGLSAHTMKLGLLNLICPGLFEHI